MKPHVMNHKMIRTENRKKILQLLIRNRESTIPEIAQETRISIPTVAKNISQLVKEGMAQEAGVSVSTGGRKPMMIKFLPDSYYAFGVDFGIEDVRIVLTNLDSAMKADRILRNVDYNDFDRLLQMVQQEVNSILLEKSITASHILGIGMSLPGTVNEETRFLKLAPNIGLKNLGFAKYASLFPFPMFLENDANAAAMAELTLGAAKNMENLIYIAVMPQGIGCGIVVGGHLYRGKNKRAGELSHMAIASHGRQCSCGRKDCWEMYASTNALVNMYREKTGKEIHSIHEVFACLRKYEPAAAEVFNEYLDYLAAGIKNIILIQDPHYIIIGGVLSVFEEFFLEPLREKVFVENDFYDRNDVEVMCSTLKSDASVLGAALLPFEKVFSLHGL